MSSAIPDSDGATGVTLRARLRRAHAQRIGALLIFGIATLLLAVLIWMGVAGIGFPTWLLALTTVL